MSLLAPERSAEETPPNATLQFLAPDDAPAGIEQISNKLASKTLHILLKETCQMRIAK